MQPNERRHRTVPYGHGKRIPQWRQASLTRVPPTWGLYRAHATVIREVLEMIPDLRQVDFGARVELDPQHEPGRTLVQQQVSSIIRGDAYIQPALAQRLAAALNSIIAQHRVVLEHFGRRSTPVSWQELVDLSDRTNMPEAQGQSA